MAKGRGAEFTFVNNLPDLLSVLPEECESRLQAAATLVEGEVKELLTGQGGGRRYKVPASNVTWQASAPFNAPAVRLGDLRREYKGFIEGQGLYAEGIVASPMIYSKWLEFGTKKMAMRPHLRKAAYNVLEPLKEKFVGFFE